MAQVVTAQPGTTVVVQQTHVQRDWNSGVFGCFGDIGSCKLIVFYLFVFQLGLFIIFTFEGFSETIAVFNRVLKL